MQLRHYESERENVFTWNVWNQIIFRRCSEHYPPLPLGWSVCFFLSLWAQVLYEGGWSMWISPRDFCFFRSHHSVVQPFMPKMKVRNEKDKMNFLEQTIFPQLQRTGWLTEYFLQTTRWWFQTFFIFTPSWERFPIWLIFFKGVGSTTN